ncbi:unnamed protein product, partial [Ectocarpus sp. 8 AP-2014]
PDHVLVFLRAVVWVVPLTLFVLSLCTSCLRPTRLDVESATLYCTWAEKIDQRCQSRCSQFPGFYLPPPKCGGRQRTKGAAIAGDGRGWVGGGESSRKVEQESDWK